ncbi:efflux RND transporter periplasmic adaptor subunit [Flavobacterium sp. KACC 22761]|uniref:efflux RND transporter periplasmic adaptor subunit n=1 Tax=Flavobacterium sp. KACC 22761 TaxID=3092665 RepID=UPI002A762905|nr:efflux RND transporter periplasmic adaptor subunit [Flavobacterium sp. KACC 22761]WPO78351.1 efflux RND transporter periplasmic adaptor subunit [Flavobacterium sp. KACC 22761]
MKKKIIFAFTIALLMLISCGKKEENKQVEAGKTDSNLITLSAEQAKNAGIVIGNPVEKELSAIVQLQGEVTVPPNSLVNVTFPLGGYIKRTNIVVGMHVRKGQVLAVIEDMQYIQLQQDYLTAKEQFKAANLEFSRQKELNAKKASSDKVFEQVTAERETQRIAMASLAQKLELLGLNVNRLNASNITKAINVVSPVNGLVSKVNINNGKYVSPTEMLFELTNIQDVMLTFTVFEKDVQSLKEGQKLEVYSNSNPEKKFSAKIQYINHSLNQDRATEVIARLDRYDSLFLPGLFVNADIHIMNIKQLTLPENAIVDWKGKSYVFEDNGNNSYKIVAVKAGIAQNGFKQFSSEVITSSSKLVVENAYTLLMKAMNESAQ